MMSKQAYKSDAFEAIHSSARALHRVGAITKATMRDFDAACLSAPPAYAPGDIQRLREANNVSQCSPATSTPASPPSRSGRLGPSAPAAWR